MILKQDTFTYEDMVSLLTSAEVKTLLEIIKHMNEDNLVYLYQGKPSVVDKITVSLCVSRATVQNRVSSIISKQDEMRYFLYKVNTGIKGEYFISPHLALTSYAAFDTIFSEIIPVLGISEIKGEIK